MKIEACRVFLAVLQICPFFDVMIGPIDSERHLPHVVGIGPYVDVLFALETQVDSVRRRSPSVFHPCSSVPDAILLYFHCWRSFVFAATVPPI
jgi:hypothetical protein